jgi:hypothetical protein
VSPVERTRAIGAGEVVSAPRNVPARFINDQPRKVESHA